MAKRKAGGRVGFDLFLCLPWPFPFVSPSQSSINLLPNFSPPSPSPILLPSSRPVALDNLPAPHSAPNPPPTPHLQSHPHFPPVRVRAPQHRLSTLRQGTWRRRQTSFTTASPLRSFAAPRTPLLHCPPPRTHPCSELSAGWGFRAATHLALVACCRRSLPADVAVPRSAQPLRWAGP